MIVRRRMARMASSTLVMLTDRPSPKYPLFDVSAGNNRFHASKRGLIRRDRGEAIVVMGHTESM